MVKRKIVIGYISLDNPTDRKVSSGTPYKINERLRSIGDVIYIPVNRSYLYRFFCKFCAGIRRLTGKNIDNSHTVFGARLLSKSINRKLINQCDILFAPLASGWLGSLKTDKPIIYLSDATFSVMVDYYWSNLSKWSISQGNKVEQEAMDCASRIVLSSDWAAQSAINDYHQPESKIHVVEFGANIDDKDIIKRIFHYDGHLHLLFLGVDWERKGGNIAVETCRYLNENGIKATLHIVGIHNLNDTVKQLPFVDYAGFLNKNIPEEYQRLVEIIKKSHCLLLPTIAECSAIAFCESSANGLPIFSHITGGVRNYVTDGKNGYLLPLGSTGEDFGKKIQDSLFSGELEQMSKGAIDVYNEKLNWNVWGEKVKAIINDVLC